MSWLKHRSTPAVATLPTLVRVTNKTVPAGTRLVAELVIASRVMKLRAVLTTGEKVKDPPREGTRPSEEIPEPRCQ
jgi:hypothetical protein